MPSLIQFLKSHDCTVAAYASPQSGRIIVACYVSDPAGRVTVRADSIPATMEACKNWLGY